MAYYGDYGMRIVVGSQTREDIEDTDYVVSSVLSTGQVVLRSIYDGHCELWIAQDDHAEGYVIVISSVGHRFVREY
jgi:hypothetical protein